jgi:hypothetical protein
MRAGGVEARRLPSCAEGHGFAMDDTDASNEACKGWTEAAAMEEQAAMAFFWGPSLQCITRLSQLLTVYLPLDVVPCSSLRAPPGRGAAAR